eukprot:Polyplicarium_translucidae@DN2293_c0_g1_i2.p1
MSSLAAARADGFYYGTQYRKEHGSLNTFRGSHPLGVRAKKIGEGIIIIRFEMPFKVWCTECEAVVAKGVRYNAEKKCVGQYHSTKIYEFAMKCYKCPNIFKIRTDPQNAAYTLEGGLRMKTETFDAKDAETTEFDDEELQKRRADPMYFLEQTEEAREEARAQKSALEELQDIQERDADDAAMNALL